MADGRTGFSLSVVVRTQGRRPTMLREALTSLVEQTDQHFDVVLVEHDGPGTGYQQEIVPDELLTRTQVVGVRGGGRAVPLNRGLEVAIGSHVAFLDDDDLARRDWVSNFREGAASAPGMVIRAVTADLPVRSSEGDPGYRITGPETVPDGRARFDLVAHVATNATPICAFAAPLDRVRSAGIRFGEDLPVLEDYGFFLEAALRFGVHDTGRITSIYRRWEGAGSWDTVDRQVWLEARSTVIGRLAGIGGHAPAGTVPAIADLLRENDELRGRLAETIAERDHTRSELRAELRRLARERDVAHRTADRMARSLSWKLTAPLRSVRSALGRRPR